MDLHAVDVDVVVVAVVAVAVVLAVDNVLTDAIPVLILLLQVRLGRGGAEGREVQGGGGPDQGLSRLLQEGGLPGHINVFQVAAASLTCVIKVTKYIIIALQR